MAHSSLFAGKSERNQPSRKSIDAPFLLAALVLLSLFLFHLQEYLRYFPYGDDPAVFGASARNPSDWFTHGFSRYFLVYPGWSVPFTDFLRPGVNGIIRLYEIFFGHHYVLYFAAFYIAQFVLVALVLLMAREFAVSLRIRLLLAFLLAVQPAFFNFGLTSIANQFDLWCGFFAVAALFCLARRRFVAAFLLLTLAVFTKEAALYAPLAAALTVVITTRRKLVAATMLLPLVAWVCVRKFLFMGTAQGLYAVSFASPKAFLLGILKGVLQWPTGLLPNEAVKKILHHQDLLHCLPSLVILTVNILFWILLIGLGIRLLPKDRLAPLGPFIVYLWLCGALSFGVLVGPDPRFGGSIYPLELLLFAVAATVFPASYWKSASMATLGILLPLFMWHICTVPLEEDANGRFLMHRLDEALIRNGMKADSVYILDSPPSFSAPEYLASFAGISGHVIVLNEFDGCLSTPEGHTLITRRSASEMDIAVQLPSCAHIKFDSVPTTVLLGAFGGAQFPREGVGLYSLPAGRVTGHAIRNAKLPDIDPGEDLHIVLGNFVADRAILLYYDWTTASYHCIGKGCADTYHT